MSGIEDDGDMRPRTIRWHVDTDRLAKRLAAERDLEGGVSELLEKLVKREEYEPRLPFAEPTSGYKQEIQQSKKLSIKGLKGPNKKT
jgi:hypothetical protein